MNRVVVTVGWVALWVAFLVATALLDFFVVAWASEAFGPFFREDVPWILTQFAFFGFAFVVGWYAKQFSVWWTTREEKQ